jgi:cytochrome P450
MGESTFTCQALPQLLATANIFPFNGLSMVVTLALGIFVAILFKRRQTKRLLEGCGLPTVHWRPRFINYLPFEEDQKMASSTITRILPRMERLGGPFGMYGTVYGISTAVIHVAHPAPARAIFGSGVATSVGSNNSKRRPRRSSIVESTGASKSPAYDHFKNFCGEGVFTANGEDWKAKRSAVTHCLIKGTTSSMSEISQRLENEANRAADAFCSQVQALQKNRKDAVTVNVVPLLQRSTIGLIYRYITHDEPEWAIRAEFDDSRMCKTDNESVETSSLSSEEDSVLASEQTEKIGNSRSRTTSATKLVEAYLNAIIRIRMIILAQSRSIWFLLPRWCYRFFSPLYRDEEETVGPIRFFARNACNRAKPGSPLAKLKEMSSHNRRSPVDGIPKDLLDEAITLLFAGQDTSAATLSWTLHLLSLFPDIQLKLADEVRTVLQSEGSTGRDVVVGRKTISKLPYLDAVIKESMRLYPVAPFVVRRIMDDLPVFDENNDGEKTARTILPAGSIACIWIYGLHRNPAFWKRPGEFLPERWIDPELKDIGQTNGAYMPFASGPRNCVGQPLAHIILRTVLTRLMHRYEFRDDRLGNSGDSTELRKDMQAGFTVLPSGGVTLSIHERKK